MRKIDIRPPAQIADKLLFRAFDRGVPIAHARVKRVPPGPESGRRADPVRLDTINPAQALYALQMIEVNQNYRKKGIGSEMLKSILDFCAEHNIPRLEGKIQGDTKTLEHWYRNNGFQVDEDKTIKKSICR